MGNVPDEQPNATQWAPGIAGILADPPKLAVIAACAAILGLRRAQAWSNPQFWAEDAYFYQQARQLGWHSFLAPLAGYLHTVLRIIALVASRVDPGLAPGVFVGGATVATLYVAGCAVSRRCPLPRFAGLFALAVVLVPDTHEVLLNLVNLQWVLAVGLILLLLSGDPATRGQWAHDVIAGAAMGLTGPFSILLVPFFLFRAWMRRSRPSALLAAIIAACGALQTYFVISAPKFAIDPPGSTVVFSEILPLVGRRIGGSLLMGSLQSPDTDLALGTIAGLLTLGGLGFLALRPGAYRKERLLLGLIFAVVIASVLCRVRHSLGMFFTPHTRARYVFVPQLVAIWLLLLTAVQAGRAARICTVLIAWGLLVNIPTYREAAYRDMNWASYAARIREGEEVDVPINPPGWILKIPGRAPAPDAKP
jgi:hypothetical protein